MESMDKDLLIAKLVLGYLKDKHSRTYREFLRSYMQHNYSSISKYISTRFCGLTLEDVLKQYFELYQIVQARLEETNYFSEKHHNSNIVEQVLYLLCNGQPSKTSTPCPSFRSPSESNFGGPSPWHEDHTSDIEATPAHVLPGNASQTLESAKEKLSPMIALDGDVVAKTLLDNPSFHEKIAQTINKVAEKKSADLSALDELVKTVVKETEEDPMFDQILDEMIGCSHLIEDIADGSGKSTDKSSCKSSNCGNIADPKVKDSSKPPDTEAGPHNPKPGTGERVDQQNQEAIQQITEVAQANQNTVQITTNNEVTVFNGTLDKYVMSNSCPLLTPVPNPLYINTGVYIPSSTKQYYVIPNPTEQDILAMPTIIVTEGKPVTPCSSKKKKKTARIKPQNQPLLPHLTKASCNSKVDKDTPQQGLKKVLYPKKKPTETSQVSNDPNVENVLDLETKTDNKPSTSSLPEILTVEDHSLKTPPPSDNIQKITPKSSSHVRNLDFSTPPKITSSARKSLSRPPVRKINKENASKSLFTTKESETKPKNIPNAWDADIRSKIGVSTGCTPKKVKRKTTTRRRIRKIEQSNLNETIQDAALIEAALKTPDPKARRNSVSKGKSKEADVAEKDVAVKVESKEEMTDGNQTEETNSKTVLSPSKFGISNKRNIIAKESECTSTFITPETEKPVISCPVNANRNITPLLETPFKEIYLESIQTQTPAGKNQISQCSNMTPFSKMLEANLPSVNISQIPTPNPITPNFSLFTPNVDFISPYSNRPTDYSTGSSYYQPSDNEHNKSLEMHLLEMEKKPVVDTNTLLKITTEHRDMFNKSVIGKKNLNLVKRQDITSSSSESSDCESDKDSSFDINKESNDTVIFRETTKHYSLRQRVVTAPKKEGKLSTKKVTLKKTTPVKGESKSNRKQQITKPVRRIISSEDSEEEKMETNKHNNAKSILDETKILSVSKELEAKRIRTLEALKSVDKKAKSKSSQEQPKKPSVPVMTEVEAKKVKTSEVPKNDAKKLKRQNNKFMKLKPIPNINTRKKSITPKKHIEDLRNILEADLQNSDDSDTDLSSLRLSPISDIIPKTVASQVIPEKKEVSGSDTEAQKLVDGLKERGIHLMHKKTPKLKTEDLHPPHNEPDERLMTVDNKESAMEPEDARDWDTVTFETETLHVIHDESLNGPTKLESLKEHKVQFTIILGDTNEQAVVVFKATALNVLFDFVPKDYVTSHILNPKKLLLHRSAEETQRSVDSILPKQDETNRQLSFVTDNVCNNIQDKHNVGDAETNKSPCRLSNDLNLSASPKIDDHLMDFAVSSLLADSAEPKESRKRKADSNEDAILEEKRKKLLQCCSVDVDKFLDTVHGPSK